MVQEPWEISPNLFEANIDLVRLTVNRVLSLFQPERPRLYFVDPSFTIHVGKKLLDTLKDGQIPPDAFLSGEGGWETIFGKQANTVSWSWQEVTKDLITPEPWIYPLAVLMWQAYDTRRVPYPSVGIRIKFAQDEDDEYRVYRLTLKRAEGTEKEVKFAFAVAAVVTPYEPALNPRETALYHLYNLTWFFRRRLLERELKKFAASGQGTTRAQLRRSAASSLPYQAPHYTSPMAVARLANVWISACAVQSGSAFAGFHVRIGKTSN